MLQIAAQTDPRAAVDPRGNELRPERDDRFADALEQGRDRDRERERAAESAGAPIGRVELVRAQPANYERAAARALQADGAREPSAGTERVDARTAESAGRTSDARTESAAGAHGDGVDAAPAAGNAPETAGAEAAETEQTVGVGIARLEAHQRVVDAARDARRVTASEATDQGA